MKPLIAGLVVCVSFAFAPLAQAETIAVPISDPYTDTLQFWSSIASSIEYIAQETTASAESALSALHLLASAFPQTQMAAAVATSPQQTTSLAAVVASFETSVAASSTADTPATVQSVASSPPVTTSQPVIERVVQYEPLASQGFITQPELTAQLQQLSNSLTSELNSNAVLTVPAWAPSQAIDQLDNVTITNASLTASEIPALDYFPSTSTISIAYGGTGISNSPTLGQLLLGNGSGGYGLVATSTLGITGGASYSFSYPLTNSSNTISLSFGTTTANIWSALNLFSGGASTTNFSNFGTAYFGGTATSTFDSAGDLTVAGSLIANGNFGLGTTTPGSIFSVNNILNLTAATSTFYGTGGINLSGGCFSVSGTCIGGGGSSFPSGAGGAFTVDSGQTVSAGNLVSLLADGDIAPAGSTDAGGIDFGTPVVVSSETSGLTNGNAASLSATSYVFAYVSGKLTTDACSVSGTTVTCGTPIVASNSTTVTAPVDLSSSTYEMTYLDSTNSSKLTTVACSVSGTTVTCGTPVVVSNSTNSAVVADLSSTSYALTYKDSTNSSKLTTVACSVSGTTVTCGTPVVVSNSTNTGLVTDLSSTSYELTYSDSTNSSKLTTAACSVSGTTVTCGTPVVASNTTGGLTSTATFLSSTSYALTYKDSTNSSVLTTAACSVSGTTVTCGTPVVASNTTGGLPSNATFLSSTSYALTYLDSTNSSVLTTAACSVSGTTVTCGTPVVASNSTNSATITDLSSTSYTLTYKDSTNSSKFTTVACSVSGTTVTCGTPIVVSNSTTIGTAFDLSSSTYAFQYEDTTNSNKFTTAACSVSGTTVTCGTPVVVSNSTDGTAGGAATDLSSSSYALTYVDTSNDSQLTTIIGTFVSLTSSYPVGVASTGGSAGQSINVVANGIASGFSGLNIGTVFYANTNGTIDATATPERLGIAISPTQIELSPAASGPNTSTLNFGDAVFANNFRITEAQTGLPGLIFENDLGSDIAELDEDGNWAIQGTLTSQGIASTTLQGLLATSTTADTGYDFVGNIMDTIASRLATPNLFLAAISTTSTTSALATTSTPLDIFADTFLQSLFSQITQWLGNAQNGITDLYATVIHASTGDFSNELCVGSTCVTPAQFQAMVTAAGQSNAATSSTNGATSSTTSTDDATDTPPIIQINGNNPAIVQIGDSYNDLGATITGPQADLNLGIQTYLNGTLTSNFVIDTSAAATDTIDYVATDQNGLTSTSTRTVIIEAMATTPTSNMGTTTDATTTTQ